MSTDTLVYGVRGPDPRNTAVKAGTRQEAEDMLLPHDVIVVSTDGGKTWTEESPAEPLLDPDCRDGKCGSCVGGVCEHDCHQSGGAQ